MRLSLLLFALSFVLSGCPRPLDENGERRKDVENRRAAQQEAAERASGAVVSRETMDIEVEADTLRADDPARRLTARIGYPALRGDVPALWSVNEQLMRTADEMMLGMAPEEPLAEDAPPYERYEFWGGFEVEYLSESYVSVLQTLWAYTGGAHGNTFFAPQTYDLQTGRPLALDDVLAPGQPALDALHAAVARGLVQEAARKTGDPVETAAEHLWMDDLTTDLFDARWTMGADSLVIHFAPYDVSAYVYGSWRVPVAYSDLEGHLGPVAAALAAE